MLASKDTGSGSGKVLKTIGAITALLGAVAGLVGALAAAGVFDDGSDETTPTVIVQQPERDSSVEQSQPSAQATSAAGGETPAAPAPERAPERTDITLTYLGDAEGCTLGIQVEIADRSYFPTGSTFTAGGVLTGSQDYNIFGTIACPFSGQCEASGGGTIDVAAGRTYFVQWLNTDFGVCDIGLAS